LEDDGDYFTWTREEAEVAIADAAAFEVAAAYYDIGTAGEMSHNPAKNVLFAAEPLEAVATRLNIGVETAMERLRLARERLRAARDRRTAPFVDRSRYTSWNGMLAGGLLRAGVILDDPWALEHGLKTLRRIRNEQPDPAALRHSPAGSGGLLDDQVQVALAAIEAHEVTSEREWLTWSVAILDRVWAEYLDEEHGGLFDTATRTGEGLLPTRVKPVQDAPTPSPNGVAALCAARLAELTGDARWAERRDALMRVFAGAAVQLGIFGATLLLALDWAVHPATHLVIVQGGGDSALADELHRMALRTFLPRRVVQRIEAADPAATSLPSPVRAMLAAGPGVRAYACIGTRCLAPATSAAEWVARLRELTASTG
jgi:hypothetical protein